MLLTRLLYIVVMSSITDESDVWTGGATEVLVVVTKVVAEDDTQVDSLAWVRVREREKARKRVTKGGEGIILNKMILKRERRVYSGPERNEGV